MFYKKVNHDSYKECFEFLTNHFEYDTMNSWNGCRSIANNVKVYNLPVNYAKAMRALEEDEYRTINQSIEDWEHDHPGFEVYFNGRSGGYLVLTRKGTNAHVFKEDWLSPVYYDDYDAWKEDVQRDWGSLKAYHPSLLKQVEIVQEFDKLCDNLIEDVKFLIEEMDDRNRRTHNFSATKRFVRYYYETLDDLKYHMEYMKQCGYYVWEYSETELYAEYEMNEAEEGSVILEE